MRSHCLLPLLAALIACMPAPARATERAWIAYADAFIAFAAQLKAGPGADAIKTLLTSQRIAALNEFARYLPS